MLESEALAKLATARLGHLATVRPTGAPHLVPVVFALIERRLVSPVDHKPKRSLRLARLDNIRHEGRVTLLVDHYQEDWTGLWWVRVDGVAETLESIDPASAAALTEKYPQYRDNPPTGPGISIEIGTVSGWSSAG
jgi:PPOX class probable F420-dependent enzyme